MSDATTSTTPSGYGAVMLAAIENYFANVFGGWMPARIHTVINSRRVKVELLIQDGDASYGVIDNVPLLQPGRVGAFIKWTPQVGDTVLVLFCARSADRYLTSGGSVNPEDARHHDLNDAIAFPVASFDFAHTTEADPQIEFTDTEIHAGGSAALALNQKLIDLKTAINSWTPVANDGGAALKAVLTSLFATWPGSGTAKLKGG